MPRVKLRNDSIIAWIESYCLIPFGPHRGERACLKVAQRAMVHEIYDAPGSPLDLTVDDRELAAWLALLHTCGPQAPGNKPPPVKLSVDIFTIWAAVGPDARPVLRRDGEAITCPALGTRFPRAA